MIFNNPLTFRVYKPLPKITNFTITNVPPYTRWRQVIFYINLLIRFTFVVTALCLIYLKFRPSQTSPFGPLIPELFHPALNRLSIVTSWLNGQGIWSLALFTISFSLFGLCEYKEETLTVISRVGVRVSSANIGWWGRSEYFRRIIMLDRLEDMLIHEGFIGSKTKLAIAVQNEDELMVVFPTLLPDRKVLELVGRESKNLLERRPLPVINYDSEDDDPPVLLDDGGGDDDVDYSVLLDDE